MEKSEWRETFNRQLVHYLFFDFTIPFPIDNVNMICQVLRNIIVLSNSLKGSPRFLHLAIYVLSSRPRCIFPLQSVKQNYMKLQISLESFQASHSISSGETAIDSDSLTDILQDCITQYEKYFQNAAVNSEEWSQIQMVFFSAQTSHDFAKMVQKALSSIHIAYINRIQTIIFRNHGSTVMSNSLGSKSHASIENSPDLYENDELDEMISSLIHFTEIDADVYQLESIMKQWLHDHSTDSDHLRLIVGDITLRCDLRECLLNVDSLSVSGQFCLCHESANPQHSGRPGPASRQTTKLPIYVMEALAVVRKEGLCESLLFGYSFTAVATRCWKIDWDELDRNQQLFQAVTHHLHEQGLVLLARKGTINRTLSSDKGLPTGIFAFFPARNTLLVKSVASGELILPGEEISEKEIPEEVKVEVKVCLESLELKALYNPMTVTAGLCSYLTSFQTKRIRPTAGFVTPIVAREEDRCDAKRRKKLPSLPTVKVSPSKIPYRTDFMTASDILRLCWPLPMVNISRNRAIGKNRKAILEELETSSYMVDGS